jgi:hypothetical protein
VRFFLKKTLKRVAEGEVQMEQISWWEMGENPPTSRAPWQEEPLISTAQTTSSATCSRRAALVEGAIWDRWSRSNWWNSECLEGRICRSHTAQIRVRAGPIHFFFQRDLFLSLVVHMIDIDEDATTLFVIVSCFNFSRFIHLNLHYVLYSKNFTSRKLKWATIWKWKE